MIRVLPSTHCRPVCHPTGPGLYLTKFRADRFSPGAPLNAPGQPVVRVSWNQAMALCSWFSARTGVRFALPTEAQWEYACRAGSAMRLFCGDVTADFSEWANVADARVAKGAFLREAVVVSHPSGGFWPVGDWSGHDAAGGRGRHTGAGGPAGRRAVGCRHGSGASQRGRSLVKPPGDCDDNPVWKAGIGISFPPIHCASVSCFQTRGWHHGRRDSLSAPAPNRRLHVERHQPAPPDRRAGRHRPALRARPAVGFGNRPIAMPARLSRVEARQNYALFRGKQTSSPSVWAPPPEVERPKAPCHGDHP